MPDPVVSKLLLGSFSARPTRRTVAVSFSAALICPNVEERQPRLMEHLDVIESRHRRSPTRDVDAMLGASFPSASSDDRQPDEIPHQFPRRF